MRRRDRGGKPPHCHVERQCGVSFSSTSAGPSCRGVGVGDNEAARKALELNSLYPWCVSRRIPLLLLCSLRHPSKTLQSSPSALNGLQIPSFCPMWPGRWLDILCTLLICAGHLFACSNLCIMTLLDFFLKFFFTLEGAQCVKKEPHPHTSFNGSFTRTLGAHCEAV